MGERWAILLYCLDISGGANVVFEHALYAYHRGVEITIFTKNNKNTAIASWHKETEKFIYRNIDDNISDLFDICIATEWHTAFGCHRIRAKKYFYFVQSIESRFYKEDENVVAYMADATYEMDLQCLTEATWIKEYLKKRYEKSASIILNGIDKRIFSMTGEAVAPRETGKVRFLVEGLISNWRKNVKRTIELCRQAGVEELWVVTAEKVDDIPGVDRIFCHVPISQMAAIYRSCDVLVKLSLVEGMFGPPLEMFHCGGTAITYDIEGAEEYLKNGYNAVVVPKNDEKAVVSAIQNLISDRKYLDYLKRNALHTAEEWPDWNTSSEQFYNTIKNAPEISDEAYDNLCFKGKAGEQTCSKIENWMRACPQNNRVSKAVDIIQRNDYKLLIFGAGFFAKGTIIQFADYDIEIYGIVVSNSESNPKTVVGHKVISVDEVKDDKDSYLVYISTEKYMKEASALLTERGFKHLI